MNIRIVKNSGWDVWKNFAIETYILNHLNNDEMVLYLWQSSKCAMLGKNQNAWRECNVKLLEKESGKIARRITGGGTIYCDKGNMLFSFIVPKVNYDVNKQLSVIIKACEIMGISAEKSGRNDLTIEGKKFSGNAFYQNSRLGLHHGSILISEDVENMVRYLTPSLDKISSKGIQSVRSRVTNLSNYSKDITMANFKEVISEACTDVYDYEHVVIEDDPLWFEADEIYEIYDKYKSWDWIYGKSAEADVVLEKRFEWGEVQMHFKLKNAKIENATVYSDALDQDYIEGMANIFLDQPFKSSDLVHALSDYGDTPTRKQHSEDLRQWLLLETI